MLDTVNEILGNAFAAILPESPLTALVVKYSAITLTIIVLLVVIAALFIAFFFDFVKDAWKIPLGIGIDALKYYGLFQPWALIAAGIAGAVLFIAVSNAGFLRWIFAAASLAAGILALIWGGLVIGVLLAIVPVNTVLIFISTIID